MSVFKCKMCGGSLEITESMTVCECGYCGTQQTLPRLDNDRRANLYDRANHFRRNNDFDKAMGIYEQILNEDTADAEAYWSLVLCRYGIEYVEDPLSHKRVPTVNRTQFTSVFDDDNYKSALQYADPYQKSIYEKEANAINEIQKGILAISQKEAPFDVFICYKETDRQGRRTPDSVLANDLYHQLVQEGFKVFFSRITLEDKLGSAYEPYIFAALNSAKVMVVLGTKPEYFNAVWVKNEWSRFLALIKNDGKKALIPAYKDMDPYDLPEEFSHLQAQDMSKLGFMQDLIRGIKKIVGSSKSENVVIKDKTDSGGNGNVEPLLRRVFMFLEDGDWETADEYCEKVLDMEPENAFAYFGKLMAELCVQKKEDLRDCEEPFDDNRNYKKALRFADEKFAGELEGYIAYINERNENACRTEIYDQAVDRMGSAHEETEFKEIAEEFDSISGFKDADALAAECLEKAETARKEAVYRAARSNMFRRMSSYYESAIELFKTIPGWKDADELIEVCRREMEETKKQEEANRLKREQWDEERRIAAEKAGKKRKIVIAIITPCVCVCIVWIILWFTVIFPRDQYKKALEWMEAERYQSAIEIFQSLGSYKDSEEKLIVCHREAAGRVSIAAGGFHTVGLRSDGTVVAVGSNEKGQCDVSGWTDIVAVAAGEAYTVGLRSDGTVVAVGDNRYGQCNVSDWVDIVAIAAGGFHTVGLRSDGKLIAAGDNGEGQCDVSWWSDAIAIAANYTYTLGLQSDGTAFREGSYDHDIYDWEDIIAIAAGEEHTVGLKADGKVVTLGYDKEGRCGVSNWKDIVAVAAGKDHTIGLRDNGKVVAAGSNADGKCAVSDWTDTVAVSASRHHTVGLRVDGTVVAVGNNEHGQCDTSSWSDIKVPEH